MTTGDRLQRAAAVLETLDYCRVKAKRPLLGAVLELQIIDKELALLEESTELAEVDARYGEQNGLHSGTTRSA